MVPGCRHALTGPALVSGAAMHLRSRGRAWASRIGPPTLAILLATALAAALRLTSLAAVPGNPYYDAAVLSMGRSWHNFFFAAFEPSARLAVDKPPVDLWFQVLSVKLFGFHSVPLKLPEALAGTAAIPLLYDLVRRLFGTAAGLVSALALALLPISVLTARSDTMDSLMMALMVLAAWLVVRAAETGRARYLYGAAAVLGVDFNVKLFEALIPLPALGLLYFMSSPLPRWRRIEQGVAALLVLLAVALSWSAAVSLAPTTNRPFAIGSRNGSIWDAAFVFNGIHRLQPRPSNYGPAGPPAGPPSPTRLLTRDGPGLGLRIGSELLPAIVLGGLALALALGPGAREEDVRGSDDRKAALRRAGALAIAVWLATGLIGFSAMSRLELRYLEAFTPAIAAGLGVGLVTLWRAAASRRRILIAGALAISAAYAVFLAGGDAHLRLVILAGVLGAAAVALAQAGLSRDGWSRSELRRAPPLVAAGLVLVALLAVPARDSIAIVRDHSYDSSAGGGFLTPHEGARLSRYLTSHAGRIRYEAAVATAWQAASLVVLDGRPVLVTRNVDGAPLTSAAALRQEVLRGNLRYVIAGAPCMLPSALSASQRQSGCPPAARWAQRHGTLVAGIVPRLGLYRMMSGPLPNSPPVR
jgi:4-amino-4-deoxy-L-arabinose transferase-like glycosyltransferase